MKTIELYDVATMAYVDYDFEKCEHKEILTKMLENSIPQPVEQFDSKGTKWYLGGEFYDEFDLYINGALLGTSDLICNYIEEFLLFLPHLACMDNKKLICPFEYEGIVTAFITTPLEYGKIRVSVFKDGELYKKYRPDNKFGADIIINKDTFLKQLYELLEKLVKDYKKKCVNGSNWAVKTEYILRELDKYFENPKKYKEEYSPERHTRIFDVAYKDLENTWKFMIALDGDTEANPMHWEREKERGAILDYDIFEQYPACLYDWNEDFTTRRELSSEEIIEKAKRDMNEREENNWVYSLETKKWYAPNEVMPYLNDETFGIIYGRISYEIKLEDDEDEDVQLADFNRHSYDIDGDWNEDNLGYMTCSFILKSSNSKFAEIKFNYRNYKKIREGLEKVANGEYARFDLNGQEQEKLHIWQYLYENSKSTDARDVLVACYGESNRYDASKELYNFTVDKKEFVHCFTEALDTIEKKLKTIKHVVEVGEKLKIEDKFKLSKSCLDKISYIETFKGDYACVCKRCLDGWGIINRNLEWVIKPEHETILGDVHPKYGQMIKGTVRKYDNLHNIDGKLFIATKYDGKQFVMDIKEDIQIPHVSDKIYYTYLNDELFFLAIEEDKTYIVNSKGEDLLTLDFRIGEKFWLFDDILIVSKDDKYGIVDWKGKVKIDFIFTSISPDKDNLDLIPVRYIDQWGFINRKGKVIDMKIKGE